MKVKSFNAKAIIQLFIVSGVAGLFLPGQLKASGQFTMEVEKYNQISFSPDGEKIALLFEKYVSPYFEERKIEIHWCRAANPEQFEKVKIDDIGEEYKGYVTVPTDFRFSPDSQHVAVFTPYHLSVVNLNTKKLVRLNREKERVTSFQWLNKDEIGLVVHEIISDEQATKTFWRQNISKGPGTRKKIFQDVSKPELRHGIRPFNDYPQEFWSPKGKYVIYIYPDFDCLKILDVSQGTVKKFGSTGSYLDQFPFNGVAWKSDESGVFCVGGTRGKSQNNWAYLVQTSDGKVIDYSRESQKTFGEYDPDLETLWTADGKYIVANHYLGLGPCMIQPNPWTIITLDEKILEKQLGPKNFPDYKPQLFVMPVANWVGLCTVGYKDGPNHVEATKLAFDYKLQNFVPLFEDKGWWAISPDGKMGAVISQRGKLTIHKFKL